MPLAGSMTSATEIAFNTCACARAHAHDGLLSDKVLADVWDACGPRAVLPELRVAELEKKMGRVMGRGG